MNATTTDKATLLRMIRKFVDQRSGIDPREYSDRSSFLSDYRPMLQAGRDARILLAYVSARDSITAEDILNTTSGNRRLEWVYVGESLRLEYTTGQYFPTEYRAAACSMLAGMIWRYLADGRDSGDEIRKAARLTFGRGIARRWFS
jgi:hypothetical protein